MDLAVEGKTPSSSSDACTNPENMQIRRDSQEQIKAEDGEIALNELNDSQHTGQRNALEMSCRSNTYEEEYYEDEFCADEAEDESDDADNGDDEEDDAEATGKD